MLTLSGNTYAYSKYIKQRGGKWDAQTKTWSVLPVHEDYFTQFEKYGLVVKKMSENKRNEVAFDELYNEGAEGYNPYR